MKRSLSSTVRPNEGIFKNVTGGNYFPVSRPERGLSTTSKNFMKGRQKPPMAPHVAPMKRYNFDSKRTGVLGGKEAEKPKVMEEINNLFAKYSVEAVEYATAGAGCVNDYTVGK